MSKREKQTAFLRVLVQDSASSQPQPLLERIARAEREERCSRRAFRLVLVLGLLAIFGQFYLSLLAPDSLGRSSHLITRCLSALLVASLASCAAFLACWCWHRAMLDRVHEESRRFILAAMSSRRDTETLSLRTSPTLAFESSASASIHPNRLFGSERGYWNLFALRRPS